MTGEEMERAIGFLIESQAHLTTNVDQLERIIQKAGTEAAADREMLRSVAGAMLTFAEATTENVKLLTEAQIATSNRVDNIERRLDSVDNE